MCQTYFDRVNEEFLTNLSKSPNLHGQKTFDIWNLSKKIWSCKRGFEQLALDYQFNIRVTRGTHLLILLLVKPTQCICRGWQRGRDNRGRLPGPHAAKKVPPPRKKSELYIIYQLKTPRMQDFATPRSNVCACASCRSSSGFSSEHTRER